MNYQLQYQRLMKRAPKTKVQGEYREGHHIVPRCMGGKNKDNIVYLTPEEHCVAHQLLVKMYPGELGYSYV